MRSSSPPSYCATSPCTCVTWSPGFFHVTSYKDRDGVRLGGLYDAISRFRANEVQINRPREMQAIANLRVDMHFWIRDYSNVDDECPQGTMEVPVRDGVAVFPEELVWSGAEKKQVGLVKDRSTIQKSESIRRSNCVAFLIKSLRSLGSFANMTILKLHELLANRSRK
jgi:hypothetical protein